MAPDSQRDSVEEFINLYNLLADHMATNVKVEQHETFSTLLKKYIRQKPWLHKEKEWLQKVGDLRNAIEHDRFEPYQYLAIPTHIVLEKLKKVYSELTKPPRAIPTFQRNVITVAPQDSLAKVLEIVRHKKFSQIPVYENKGFVGLITENGITRWLVSHVADKGVAVDFGKVEATEILKSEEKRKPWQFTGKNTEVRQITQFFVEQKLLEAVIITEDGKKDKTPIGIASRWEIEKLSRK